MRTLMLCYAVLCYAMLCYAMLCYAMLCYAMRCYATQGAQEGASSRVGADGHQRAAALPLMTRSPSQHLHGVLASAL